MCSIYYLRVPETSKDLPDNWVELFTEFDIDNTDLSISQKLIFKYFKKYIKDCISKGKDGDQFITSDLIQLFVKSIISESYNILPNYSDLPNCLIENALEEIKNLDIKNFTNKVHSVFIEFLSYQHLVRDGYEVVSFNRTSGSCDLVMQKNSKTYNFEIKFKQNDDIFALRILDAIIGLSLFGKNIFCRDRTFKINFKTNSIDKFFNEILEDVYNFMENKSVEYYGKYVDICPIDHMVKSRSIDNVASELKACYIESYDKEPLKKLVKDIFLQKEGHVYNLKNKFEKRGIENFAGYLVWSLPFRLDINMDILENAFKEALIEEKFNLQFDLHVFVDKKFEKHHYFIVEADS